MILGNAAYLTGIDAFPMGNGASSGKDAAFPAQRAAFPGARAAFLTEGVWEVISKPIVQASAVSWLI